MESCGGVSWGNLFENPNDLSGCELETRTDVSVVLVVIDVLVSPSFVVIECCEDVSLDSDWDFVEPQSFSFSKKRSIVLEENRGEMSCEGTPVKALPNTERRMMPPTPQQSSHSSMDERQWHAEMALLFFSYIHTPTNCCHHQACANAEAVEKAMLIGVVMCVRGARDGRP